MTFVVYKANNGSVVYITIPEHIEKLEKHIREEMMNVEDFDVRTVDDWCVGVESNGLSVF